jgi:hypothetical protein
MSTDNKDQKGKLLVTKNIYIREKKRPSLNDSQHRDIMTLNPRESVRDEVGRSNLFKDYYKEEEKKRIDSFVSKF